MGRGNVRRNGGQKRQSTPRVTPKGLGKRVRRAPPRFTPSGQLNSTTGGWAVSPVQGHATGEIERLKEDLAVLQQSVHALAGNTLPPVRTDQQPSNPAARVDPPQTQNGNPNSDKNINHLTLPPNTSPQPMQTDLTEPPGIVQPQPATVVVQAQDMVPSTSLSMPGVMTTKLLPLYTLVSKESREAIEQGHYVEFEALMAPRSGKKPPHDNSSGRYGQQSKQEPMSSLAWTRASLRFASTIIKNHPEEAQGLLNHMEQVLMVAEDGGDWRYYDQEFRQQMSGLYKFDESRMDLYGRAMNKPKTKNSNFRAPTKFENQVPRGYCINYHVATKRCTANPCIYSHQCYRCRESHPWFLCGMQAIRRDQARGQKRTTRPVSKATASPGHTSQY